jgi:C-terminal processing protease CtpA/Prc
VAITLAADWIVTEPVFYHDILEQDGRRVGYLVFNDFLQQAIDDLDAVFAGFREAGIDELVLDLRYNSGGTPEVAVRLAGWIAGDAVDGNDVMAEMIHDESYAEADRTIFFDPIDQAPSLDRVAIITSPRTASASEMLINGLAPFMEVILVGETTYGKPVGMYVYDLCDKVFLPVTFQMVNALGEGAFFDGIPPDCPAVDDLDHALGDPEEASLSAALYYLVNGSCPPEGPTLRTSARPGIPDIPLTGFRRLIGGF